MWLYNGNGLIRDFFGNRQSSVALNNGPVTDSFTYFINLLWALILPPQTTLVCLTAMGKTINTPSLRRAVVRGQQHAALLTKCLPVAWCPALGQRLCSSDSSDKQPPTNQLVSPAACLPAFLLSGLFPQQACNLGSSRLPSLIYLPWGKKCC